MALFLVVVSPAVLVRTAVAGRPNASGNGESTEQTFRGKPRLFHDRERLALEVRRIRHPQVRIRHRGVGAPAKYVKIVVVDHAPALVDVPRRPPPPAPGAVLAPESSITTRAEKFFLETHEGRVWFSTLVEHDGIFWALLAY